MAFDTFDTDSAATAGVTFTNGNLTAQGGSGAALITSMIAQTLEGKKSGKWYVEFTCVALSGNVDGVGIIASWGMGANSSLGFIGGLAAGAPNSGEIGWAYYNNNHVTHINTNPAAVNNATWTTNDVIGMAIDLTNKKIWWRKNTGSWVGTTGTPDPATNTNGFDITTMLANSNRVYPACNLSGSAAKFTANFGASAFTGTVPSGFTSGWTNTTAGTYFGTFACTGKGSGNFATPTQNLKQVNKYTSSITGTVSNIIVAFAGATISDQKGLIYDSTGVGGLPGALLGISTNTITSASAGEVTFTFSGVNVVNGTSYWFGTVSDAVAGGTTNLAFYVPLTGGNASNTGTYASPTNPFGASPSVGNVRLPVIVNVTADATVNLSGTSATAAVGTLATTVDVSPSLSGVSATAAAGSFSLSTNQTIALSGVQATATPGTLTETASSTISLVGTSAIAACGTLIVSASSTLGLTGVEATAFAGDIRAVTAFITVPMITIMNGDPIPAYGLMDNAPVANEADMPYQVALETVINLNPIPMRGTLTAVPIPGEGSVP